MGNRSEVYVIKIQKKLQYGSILGFSKDFCLMPLVLPNIARLEYSYGANKQKINSYREKYINKAIDLWAEVRYYKYKLVITNEAKNKEAP